VALLSVTLSYSGYDNFNNLASELGGALVANEMHFLNGPLHRLKNKKCSTTLVN